MSEVKAYKVIVDLGPKDDQKTLHKFGMKTKSKAEKDMERMVKRKMNALKVIENNEDIEEFDISTGDKPGLIVIQIVTKFIDEPEVVDLVAETIQIPPWKVEVKPDESKVCVGCRVHHTER